MPLPNFFVVGAAKAGTTALYSYLRQHPQVFIPDRQEPSYFSFAGSKPSFTGPDGLAPSINISAVTERDEYEKLYVGVGLDNARGDVSPVYLYWPGTAERLADEIPDARIVAILRHPVDRAYSAFMHARREEREPIEDFASALDAEAGRIADNCGFIWRYRDLGRYAQQLSRWLSVFPRDQILVESYDVFAADPRAVCRRVQDFVGVDVAFTPDTDLRHNVSGLPRSRALRRALRSGNRLGGTVRFMAGDRGVERLKRLRERLETALLQRIPLDPEMRAQLTAEWRPDIEDVADVVDFDVRTWLDDRSVPAS
jgi:hypothetical protein